jgi:DNA-binding NarL/FixJ family response regulator
MSQARNLTNVFKSSTAMDEKILVCVVHKNIAIKTGVQALLAMNEAFIIFQTVPAQFELSLPEVIIADYEYGLNLATGSNGVNRSSARILVITEKTKEWDIRTALDVGVHGFLSQECGVDELVEAVTCLHEGRNYVSASIAEKAQRSLGRSRLTERERQVLQLVGQGYCNKLVARKLGIAEVTAKIHLQKLMEKLEATTRTHAVAIAMDIGLIDAQIEMELSVSSQRRRFNLANSSLAPSL